MLPVACRHAGVTGAFAKRSRAVPAGGGRARAAALAAAGLLIATAAEGVITASGSAPTIANYGAPQVVIDSDAARGDPAYTRHEIPVSVTVSFTKTGTTSEQLTVRASFRLIDEATGLAVPLVGEAGSPARVEGSFYRYFSSIPTSIPFNVGLSAKLQPSARLDPEKTYKVEVYLEQRSDTVSPYSELATLLSTTDYQFRHFRGPWGSDLNANVITELVSVTPQRRWLVDTDPAHDDFTAQVAFTLHRYDNPTVAAATSSVAVRLELELVEEVAPFASVPLAQALVVLNPSPTVASYLPAIGGLLQRPASSSHVRTVTFRPAPGVQLDSVDQRYDLRVRISHVELLQLGGNSLVVNGGTLATGYARHLHFNGRLDFGNIQTVMQSVNNDPSSGVTVVPGEVQTTLGFPSGGGVLVNAPGYTYGPGSVAVSLLANGDAYVRAPGSVTLVPPAFPDRATLNGVAFYRGQLTLDAGGAHAGSLNVILPAGFGWAASRTSRSLNGEMLLTGPFDLDSSLHPVPGNYLFEGADIWVAEETKPVMTRVKYIGWIPQEGRFPMSTETVGEASYVRADQLAALEAATPIPVDNRYKPSNDTYWRKLNGVDEAMSVRAGALGGAELTAGYTFGGSTLQRVRAHFPAGAYYWALSGRIEIENDLVVTDRNRSFIDLNTSFQTVFVPFSADCVDPSCGSTTPLGSSLIARERQLFFTTDGGIVAYGDLNAPLALEWGWIPTLGRHAHRTDPFIEGGVHIPGHFIRDKRDNLQLNKHAAAILFSGADPATGDITERPGTLSFPYWFGNADYAGLNFRAGAANDITPSGLRGESTLGGGAYGPYDLKGRSKYYVRKSGVSGIHDKVQTSPEAVLINGYDFTFLNFGLAFLSNVNTDSRTEGSLALPYPSDFTLDFEKLLFLCNGALDTATVKNGPQQVTAAYWNALLEVAAIDFTRDPSQLCDPGEGFLSIGVTAYAAHVEDSLQGRLGIFSHGNLIPKGAGIGDLDSRLVAPSQMRMRGPRRAAPGASGFETYTVTPTGAAYFNIIGSAPSYNHVLAQETGSLEQGFVNLPGQVRVSFFEALEAHLQMPSIKPEEPGWDTVQVHLANGTWGGTGFFKAGYHDPDNRGFPLAPLLDPHEALDSYRSSPAYTTRARQDWLGGAISFDFPVQWDFATRSFRSAQPVEDDFVVMTLEQRVAYLSAERAEVRFGSQIGLPKLNLANIVLNTLSETSGVAQAVSGAVNEALLQDLNDGLDSLNAVLADNLDAHFEAALGTQLDSIAADIHASLLSQWDSVNRQWTGTTPPDLSAFFGATQGGSQLWRDVWSELGKSSPLGQLGELKAAVDRARAAVAFFTDNSSGLLRESNGQVEPAIVQALVRALIQELAGEVDSTLASVIGGLVDAELNALMAPYLEDAQPTLSDLRTAFLEIEAALADVSAALGSAASGGFADQLLDRYVAAAGAEIPGLNSAIQAELQAWLAGFGPAKPFNTSNAANAKARIRRAITDQFAGTSYAADIQQIIKHHLFDLNGTLRGAIDSTFAQVNEVIKGTLSAAFLEIDDSFTNVLGLFSDFMASAAIDGYATFNGNALRQVRLDGKFRWNVPEETNFSAFLEINQYESGADKGLCGVDGSDAAEVILGAVNVPCDFLSPDLRVDIRTKFSFRIDGNTLTPIGFAGAFKKTAGEVSFEAFSITDLAVAVAFGETENYLSAALGLRFNSYRAKGGIFFGRTCELFPIMIWDLFVAETLGQPDPTFTGAYVYGEAHIPVSEAFLGIPASCFFEVSAGMGLGIFYFIEGPTYGARGMLSVSGSALCALSLNGRLDVAGLKQGSKFKLRGQGTVAVEIGLCPACIEASRSVSFTAETGGGKSKGGKPSVK